MSTAALVGWGKKITIMLSTNDYLIHVVTDVFGRKKSPIIYGADYNIVEDMRKPIHGMGATLLYSDYSEIKGEDKYFLDIESEHLEHYLDYADFMLSVNYNYKFNSEKSEKIAKKFLEIMKSKSEILLINPGIWSYSFDDFYDRNFLLEREVKRYSFFKNQKVFVYENI